MSFFKKISEGLKKTRDSMMQKVEEVFHSFIKVDEELFEKLEECLITADIGVATSTQLCDELRTRVKQRGITDASVVKDLLKEVIVEFLEGESELDFSTKPMIIMVIGVNGVGKTTTIGKLSAQLKAQNKKVVVAAADTFRAAATQQLEIWTTRAGVDLIKNKEGTDPASVVYDAISAGKSRNADVIICDTAGRLHNKKNLMDELSKFARIITKEAPDSVVEYLLVVDGTTGQNAINQAKFFKEAVGLTGLVITKLDGTAKGGVAIAVKNELDIPIKFIGIGEQIEDLRIFDAKEFADALFDEEQTDQEMLIDNQQEAKDDNLFSME